jgi:hypothetical protein
MKAALTRSCLWEPSALNFPLSARQPILLRQIQQEQSDVMGPWTNRQSDGAMKSLQEPQLWPLVAKVWNLTEAWVTFIVALAFVAGSKTAEPAAMLPASKVRREIGFEPKLLEFFMIFFLSHV